MVYLLNNRRTLWLELKETSKTLRSYLQDELSSLFNEPYLDEWISVHLDHSEQKRVDYIMGSLQEFVQG